MALGFENARTGIDIAEVSADSERVSSLSPYELFNEFFLEVNGSTMSRGQAALVKRLLDAGAEVCVP